MPLNSGNIVNSGTITSTTGNLNLQNSNSAVGNIEVQGLNGTFSAAGNININTSANNANISLHGGDYFSQNFNINAGNGSIDGSVGKVSGIVNLTAEEAHFGAATPDLKMGQLNNWSY
jgi:hypothetical protein